MAEWIGPRHRRPSPPGSAAEQRFMGDDEPAVTPEAPGATTSPQYPGEVPDRSTVPGHGVTIVSRATSVRRPLTEAGTAQAIMDVFAAAAGQEMEPSRFEQATAAYEEVRKAYPTRLPPERPAPGYALEYGDVMASELQEIGAGPVPTTPAALVGEGSAAPADAAAGVRIPSGDAGGGAAGSQPPAKDGEPRG